MTKGILLAGGRGTRLYPVTRSISKHLIPVYDKPMFYYPLCNLIQAGIRDILLISTPSDLPHFKSQLGTGADLGLNITYAEQPFALGIADALRIAGRVYKSVDDYALILGDNVFLGDTKNHLCINNSAKDATIFLQPVDNPQDFGVAQFQGEDVVHVIEKPINPPSNMAVTGLYFLPSDCVDIAYRLQPSDRGEIEITDLLNVYAKRGNLHWHVLPNDIFWIDTGTCRGLLNAVNVVASLQEQGICNGCIEQQAYLSGFISKHQMLKLFENMPLCDYSSAACSQ